jgi:hypothetical protein
MKAVLYVNDLKGNITTKILDNDIPLDDTLRGYCYMKEILLSIANKEFKYHWNYSFIETWDCRIIPFFVRLNNIENGLQEIHIE